MELRTEFRNEIGMQGTVQDEDYSDAEPIAVWNMTAGQLKRIPEYYSAVHAYADQLKLVSDDAKDIFYYDTTLSELDNEMCTNMGGGFPIAGFYEMKQEIYEIAMRLNRNERQTL